MYERTHPPPALRMNSVILHAQGWCEQNRADLLNCHTMKNLAPLMTAVGSVTWKMNGGVSWDDDVRFLRSEEGQRYCNMLTQKVNRLKDELSARANAPSG